MWGIFHSIHRNVQAQRNLKTQTPHSQLHNPPRTPNLSCSTLSSSTSSLSNIGPGPAVPVTAVVPPIALPVLFSRLIPSLPALPAPGLDLTDPEPELAPYLALPFRCPSSMSNNTESEDNNWADHAARLANDEVESLYNLFSSIGKEMSIMVS
ncbi:hypothetical protein BJ165DRAFT_120709 [Panaeolus papilionaceus]|nr:hypothetical protein BJ165DRAFT_120709 [Panaeolus papilionaceus]